MWLPRDERHILLAYYTNIFNLDDKDISRYLEQPKFFHLSDWTVILKKSQRIPILTPLLVKRRAIKVNAYGNNNMRTGEQNENLEQIKKEIKTIIKLQRRLDIANEYLKTRRLIELSPHESIYDVVGIKLTVGGYDLGRKYTSCLIRSGLWFAEYKHHWIWIIVSFLGGIIGGLLVSWLS